MAGSLYRLGGLVERADHVARVVDVHVGLALDRGRNLDAAFWPDLQRALALAGAGDADAHGTMLAARTEVSVAVQAARREAMSVRPSLSSEVYEGVNDLQWVLEDAGENFHEFAARIQRGVALLHGLTEESMSHDEAWEFLRLGQRLARARSVVPLVTDKLRRLAGTDDAVAWAGVLRSCSAFEAYRWRFSAAVTAAGVAQFLLLDRTLPRSARHAVTEALAGVKRIDGPGEAKVPHRVLGRLASLLEYTVAEDVVVDPIGFATAYGEIALHLEDALTATYFRPTRLPDERALVTPPIWTSQSQQQ
ncbi:MAG TPA: alpha-E domain-containing protein [Candidatus Dormibacteraeota bacterium]